MTLARMATIYFGRDYMQIKYDKAVRNRIPEIIEKSGRECSVKKLPDAEFLTYMEKKLLEEVNEYLDSKSIEELTDILEVVYRISELKGVSVDELERIRFNKSSRRGSFDGNYILISADKLD